MIPGYSPLAQAAMGTTFTWGATAFGALFCFFQPTNQKWSGNTRYMDGSLGFSAGVMLAASFWSLLQPAISIAKDSTAADGLGLGRYAFVPASIGILAGAAFIILADHFFPNQDLTIKSSDTDRNRQSASKKENGFTCTVVCDMDQTLRRRVDDHASWDVYDPAVATRPSGNTGFKLGVRFWLLILAITVHNIPEGLAVGAAFGRVSNGASESFYRARNLAIGMGIQNFPEGLAVSLPLRASGYSFWKSFWYGQLSGFVELIAGVLGCLTVQYVQPLQPYALGFAAGAMLFVVFDSVIPEAQHQGNGRSVSILSCVGFILMMALEVYFNEN